MKLLNLNKWLPLLTHTFPMLIKISFTMFCKICTHVIVRLREQITLHTFLVEVYPKQERKYAPFQEISKKGAIKSEHIWTLNFVKLNWKHFVSFHFFHSVNWKHHMSRTDKFSKYCFLLFFFSTGVAYQLCYWEFGGLYWRSLAFLNLHTKTVQSKTQIQVLLKFKFTTCSF